MKTRYGIISAAMAAILLSLASCIKTEPAVEEVSTDSTDPMRFSGQGMMQSSTLTKASVPLESGFMVSCYKAYALAKQQCVMDAYKVNYSQDDWSGSRSWNYVGVDSQLLKYWDYNNFPYRFNAIAPYPAGVSGIKLEADNLVIPAAYSSQTCANGTVTPSGNVEPFMIAQLQRSSDGTDMDIYAGKSVAGTNGSTDKAREVSLPFHHINSMVRFGVYANDTWATAHYLYIKDLSIRAVSADFVTGASGYAASSKGSWKSGSTGAGFTGLTKSSAPVSILRFDGGRTVPGNDVRDMQGRSNAYMLQCPGGLAQIPQQGVKMVVSLKLYDADDALYREYVDVPIAVEGTAGGDIFNWEAGYIYTYYLVLGPLGKLDLSFTCVLTDWDDIDGSLSTDLEK